MNKNGFGALPIQRVSADYAGMLLRKAYNAGITYFDTARSYSDSEEKMGLALSDVRENIIIATKTPSTTVGGFWQDLETSLRLLKTDYIDVYPVSYTHLGRALQKNPAGPRAAQLFDSRADHLWHDHHRRAGPVSYTHLDVYKRQVLRCAKV